MPRKNGHAKVDAPELRVVTEAPAEPLGFPPNIEHHLRSLEAQITAAQNTVNTLMTQRQAYLQAAMDIMGVDTSGQAVGVNLDTMTYTVSAKD